MKQRALLLNRPPMLAPPGPMERLKTYLTTNVAETSEGHVFAELRPLLFAAEPEATRDAVVMAMRSLGWQEIQATEGEVRAVVVSTLFRFRDDVTVRTEATEEGTLLHALRFMGRHRGSGGECEASAGALHVGRASDRYGESAFRTGAYPVKPRNESSDWEVLLALTVLWGSAFLFTKLAVDSIPPQLVVVIMGPESLVSLFDSAGRLMPMLAVLGGAFCYAVAAVLVRLRPPSDALSSAAATTLIATFMIAPFALGVGQAQYQAASVSSIVSVAVLGVFSTALASVLYFRRIKTAGLAFVSQLNYFIPPIKQIVIH